tara:strand:- start:25 stop:249 length:225 start_codon:yes stop_codon:yes gene_type:complete
MIYLCLATDGDLYNLCDCGDVEAAYASAEDMDIEPIWVLTAAESVDWVVTIIKHLDVPAMGYLVDTLIGEKDGS